MHDRKHPDAFPLWALPLAITVLFLFAVHLAYALSILGGHVPACVPYWEGCVSISRAARHGLGNHLFRLLIIPCALLHALVWWLSARWLAHEGRASVAMPLLGVLSAGALAVYATFLGTEGEVYGFLRRYGVTVYFGFGFLAQLLLMRRARWLGRISAGLAQAMGFVCLAMLGLGIGNVVAGLVVDDAIQRDRIENALEWLLGLLLVGWFALLAHAWRKEGLALRLLRAPQRTTR